jgi:hypothetical protein
MRIKEVILEKLIVMRFQALLYVMACALMAQTATAQCLKSGAAAKTEWGMGYNAAIPLGEMGVHANTVHSFAMSGFYRIPASAGRIDVGLELIAGSYAAFTRTQVFGVNGVETPVEVNYNSGVTMTSAVFRYNYFRTENLTFFAAMKGGLATFRSRIYIEDPNDPDGCKPLEDDKLIADHTWTAGVRTGANVDMRYFVKKLPAQSLMIQPYVGFVQGGTVDYINVRNTTTDDHTSHGQAATTADGGKPLDIRFVNLQTGTQHSHEVARVYTSPVQFLECGISLVMRF